MELEEQAGRILAYGEICDHCLGRFFGKRSFGLTNAERGHALRVARALRENVPFRPHEGACWICHDLFADVELWAGRVVEALAGIEYATFLIGTRVPPSWPRARSWSGLSSILRAPSPSSPR